MKTLIFETDFNHKLSSDAFVHIAPAPARYIPESALTELFQLEVRDNPQLRPVVKVVDLHRLPLGKLVNAFTIPSHGMLSEDFIEWWLKRFPGYTPDSPMAVYFYQKEENHLA